MTLQDSCDTLYKSTRKLVFKIEENRCAVTGAAATGWENKKYQPPDGDRYFLLGDGGFTPAGHKLRLHRSPPKKISPPVKRPSGIFGGGWWIRTTEGVASRFTVCPLWPLGKSPMYEIGAGGRIRTPDLLITNQLLYQLSYTSISISAVYSNRTFWVCQHIFYARNEEMKESDRA